MFVYYLKIFLDVGENERVKSLRFVNFRLNSIFSDQEIRLLSGIRSLVKRDD